MDQPGSFTSDRNTIEYEIKRSIELMKEMLQKGMMDNRMCLPSTLNQCVPTDENLTEDDQLSLYNDLARLLHLLSNDIIRPLTSLIEDTRRFDTSNHYQMKQTLETKIENLTITDIHASQRIQACEDKADAILYSFDEGGRVVSIMDNAARLLNTASVSSTCRSRGYYYGSPSCKIAVELVPSDGWIGVKLIVLPGNDDDMVKWAHRLACEISLMWIGGKKEDQNKTTGSFRLSNPRGNEREVWSVGRFISQSFLSENKDQFVDADQIFLQFILKEIC